MTSPAKRFAFKTSKRLFLVGPDIPNKGWPEKRDFCWTKPGELLGLGAWTCSNPECGCDRSFVGLTTRRATTIGIVVERDVSELTAHYESAGRAWGSAEGVAAEERRGANQLVDLLTLRRFPVGTLVRVQWVETSNGGQRFVLSEVKRVPKSPPAGRRRNPDGFWTKGPRMNPLFGLGFPMAANAMRKRKPKPHKRDAYKGPLIEKYRVACDECLRGRERVRDVIPALARQKCDICKRKEVHWESWRPRGNPAGAHDLVDIVDARTGEVLERRIFRYVAEQNAWLFRHDGNKVRIQKHKPAAKASRKPMRRNPDHGLTPHYEPAAFPMHKFYRDVAIPKGFIAQHYRHDVAPCWIHPRKRLALCIDAINPPERELEGGRRFALGVTNADYEPDPEPILETDSMTDLLWTIAHHRAGN